MEACDVEEVLLIRSAWEGFHALISLRGCKTKQRKRGKKP